jgi:hypothetical protein
VSKQLRCPAHSRSAARQIAEQFRGPATPPFSARCNSTDIEVVQLKCNHSAFSGYHETPSDYSGVRCRTCGHHWRTKSDLVFNLPRKS